MRRESVAAVAAVLAVACGGMPATRPTGGLGAAVSGVRADVGATPAGAAERACESVVSLTVSDGRQVAYGSGFYVSKDGLLLTNNHVIAGFDAPDVLATDYDGAAHTCEIVCRDPSSDLAMLRAGGVSDARAVEWGDSSKLTVGASVMTVGSPYGLPTSVSYGIVSGLHRSMSLKTSGDTAYYCDMIQTDAAINRGNSGGPLVDGMGRVVGVSSVLESDSGANAGIGFAIDGNYAHAISDMLADGRVEHAYAGCEMRTVTPDNHGSAGTKAEQGAYVSATDGDSDLRAGDVILTIGDDTVRDAKSAAMIVRRHSVGDVVRMRIERDGAQRNVKVRLRSDAGRHGIGADMFELPEFMRIRMHEP